MNWKAQQLKMQKTEQRILGLLLGDYTTEDLFWLRVDLGMNYLLRRYSYKEAEVMWNKPEFWRWYRQTWHISDKKILANMERHGQKEMPLANYMETQEAKTERYRMTQTMLKQIS